MTWDSNIDQSHARSIKIICGSSRSDRSADICYECATRLFYVESRTMITDDAIEKKYISGGSTFDDVSRIC